ncbi:MAG: hypothetical protein QOG15_1495 [Solirubrobacteraceae bacterium]|jgi:hypothetical protein|nr:hypothetical protein [Solirubrobacteraceae bacterium]
MDRIERVHLPPRTRLSCLAAALLLALTLAGLAGAAPADARAPRVVLAFLPTGGEDNPAPVLDRLGDRRQLALGMISATQGRYWPEQMMLDISAGSRTSATVYHPTAPAPLELVPGGDGTGFIFGWSQALKRADTALAEIKPGLLAGAIPGGGAYAGIHGRANVEAVAAADRVGNVARVSLGPSGSLARRVRSLERRYRFVVAGLPTAAKGDAVLDRLLRDRRKGDLLLVLQSPPRARVPQLLPAAAAGLRTSGALTSATTRLDGIVAGIDVPVTVWHRLGVKTPAGVKGQAINADGTRDKAELKTLEARLRVVSGRRTPTFGALVLTWLALVLTLGLVADRRGIRAGMRIGALAFLWVPSVLLVTGVLAPSRGVEIAMIVVSCFALGALTDRFVRWPRGPLLPSAVALVAYCGDLVAGSPLIVRSLLGVNPRSGSRFYGLGNELESTLAVLLLIAVGALLWRHGRSRAAAATFAIVGLVFCVFVGAGQLGADVGGVLTVGSGVAAATVLMLPGRPSRRTIVIAALVPVVALFGLAAMDLVTGGNGHFTRTVLQADSLTSLRDVVQRRYTLAYNVLAKGAMPLLTLIAILAAAYAVRYRERIYAPLRGSASWTAALAGGLTASVIGALFNDSGPILLAFGVFVLALATSYIRGDPELAREN